MPEFFTYQARLKRAVDGDTVDLSVDLGFRTYKKVRVRLKGIDAPEIWGVKKESEEYKKGKEIEKLVEDWIETSLEESEKDYLILKTEEETGKYGRWLGDICVPGKEKSLSERLLEEDSVTAI